MGKQGLRFACAVRNHSNCAFGKDLEGTVFKITTGGTLTTLHTFNGKDGNSPYGGLIEDAYGNFYGTTGYGGANGNGTVFKITSTGKLTTLYNSCSQSSCTDGANPYAGLAQDPGVFADLFGTTYGGGANGYGTVFEITPSGKLTTLYSFCSKAACTDGANPSAGVVTGSDGSLYGTTSYGGAGNYGTVFGQDTYPLAPTTLYSFCAQAGCADGSFPVAALVEDTDGTFYGTTQGGGDGFGTVFSWTDSTPFPSLVIRPTSGKVGATVNILGSNLTGATHVMFETVEAVFKVVSPSLITATVPKGAFTRPVSVSVPSGIDGTLYVNQYFYVTPQIKNFAPLNGPVGTSVVIKGVSLTQTTALTFGGVTATTFTVNSDTQVTATVPAGALTGKIAITTAGGTATSAKSFTVTP